MCSVSHRDMTSSVLEFREASLQGPLQHITPLRGVTLTIRPGDVVLVNVQEGRERTLLADAAQGLLLADSGSVCFMGEDWSTMSARRQTEQRGRTRRVFDQYGWITNLDMAENIYLSETHHTDRPMADIMAEADRLAAQFGLEGIPEGRPTRIHPMTLRRLEWVRAFMGDPALILLERPLAGAPKADAARLFEAVCSASRRGVCTLWMTDEDRVWGCPSLSGARRFRIEGDSLAAA
jgi:phospholipid/cholesterol/gamma-HCH transport system ATP-binding protein